MFNREDITKIGITWTWPKIASKDLAATGTVHATFVSNGLLPYEVTIHKYYEATKHKLQSDEGKEYIQDKLTEEILQSLNEIERQRFSFV